MSPGNAEWTLDVTLSGGGRRDWLHPRWYVTPGPSRPGRRITFGGPWPPEAEWLPVPAPERLCVRCGSDTRGQTWYDLINGPHCVPCRDANRQPMRRSRAARLWRGIRFTASEWTDRAYWAWCERFGKRTVWTEPLRPPEAGD